MCIGLLKKEKFEIVNNPQDAEMIIINTCGFIQSAKEEAINCILEMAEYKQNGKCKYLVVMGCLVQRYKKELEKSIPEVDLFLSIDEYDNIWEKIAELIGKEIKSKNTLEYLDRIISTGNSTAYLKIAEGCSNRCTYCAIPYIRGPYVSRPKEDILKEAKELAQKGIKELIIIAQDTTKYGIDIYGKLSLAELLKELSEIDGIKWIRFLYAYPESITDELIEVVKNNEKIRNEIPNVILRTTMIVGFPGETEQDFFELYEFINETKFEKLGVFKYSREDGTPASKIKNQIHYKTKQSRFDKIMSMQKKISQIKLEEKIGNTYEVLVDGFSDDNKYICARSYMDIPNEDGTVFIKNTGKVKQGQFINCKIIDVKDYDLIGEII